MPTATEPPLKAIVASGLRGAAFFSSAAKDTAAVRHKAETETKRVNLANMALSSHEWETLKTVAPDAGMLRLNDAI
jgi:hypothetical protein